MDPTPEPIGNATASQAQAGLSSRRALLGLCLLALGLAACEGEARWDPETGKFRIPFGRAGNNR